MRRPGTAGVRSPVSSPRADGGCYVDGPAASTRGQLGFAHRALVESCVGGFQGVPRLASTDDGQTILELSGRLYEAQEYLPAQSHFGRYPASGPLPNVAVHLP